MTTPAPDPQTPQGSNLSGLDNTQNVGSAQAQRTTELRSLAMALAQDDSDQLQVLKGVVTAVSLATNPQTLSMNLSGDTTVVISSIRFLASYSPVVGDTVLVMKCGPELWAMGKFQTSTGWTALPSLTSGLSADATDPPQYRLVIDNGSRLIQLRGKINVTSGTPTTLWTFPLGDLRPSANMSPVVIGRNSTHATTVLLFPNSNGTMTIEGQTSTADFGGGSATGVPNQNVTSWQDAGIGGSPGTFNNTPDTGFTDPQPPNLNHRHFIGGHQHNLANHTHVAPSHTHGVSYPTYFALNGAQYHLL